MGRHRRKRGGRIKAIKHVRYLPREMRGPPQNKYGGQQMQRMRGFKHSEPPPPTKGWSLSKPEIERIEAEMRAKGQLDPIPRKSR